MEKTRNSENFGSFKVQNNPINAPQSKKMLWVMVSVAGIFLMLSLYLIIFKHGTGKIELTQEERIELDLQRAGIGEWVIDGDRVFVNDDKVYISITPHTILKDSWVYFNVTSKVYTGDVDMVFGFDTDSIKPASVELYDPHLVNITYEDCSYNNDTEEETCVTIDKSKIDDWREVSGKFSSLLYDFGGMNRWWFNKNIPIVKDEQIYFRVLLRINKQGFTSTSLDSKYWFAIKPSAETINQAIDNQHLYALDPWINSSKQAEDKSYLDVALLSYYDFEGTTDTLEDVVGINNLTKNEWIGLPANASGIIGDAQIMAHDPSNQLPRDNFNGTGLSWQSLNRNFTISMWWKPRNTEATNPDLFGTGQGGACLMRWGADGNVGFTDQDDAIVGDCDGVDWRQDLNVWVHQAVSVAANGSWWLYYNGTLCDSGVTAVSFVTSGARTGVNNYAYGANNTYDEIGIWNRSLNATEIADLWNEGLGIGYGTSPAEESDVDIYLNAPDDNYITLDPSVTFNCSGNMTGNNLLNLSLLIDGVVNYTVYNSTPINELSLEQAIYLSEGEHKWNCQGWGIGGNANGTGINRTVTLDFTLPEINITYPTNTTIYDGYVTANLTQIELNWTVIDANIDSCVLFNSTDNQTLTCGENTTLLNVSYGGKKFILFANDSAGNSNTYNVSATYDYVILENSQTYNPTTFESSIETFYLNLTYDTSYSLAAVLNYNGTKYTGTQLGSGENILFSASANIPLVSAKQNLTFFWNVTFIKEDEVNYATSTPQLQEIDTIDFGLCDADTNITVLTFYGKNETIPLSNVSNFVLGAYFEFWAGAGNIRKNLTILNVSVVNSTSFCIGFNDSYTFNVDIDYSSTGFAPRSYYIRNGTIENGSSSLIPLWFLNTVDSTSVFVKLQNEFFKELDNYFIKTMRYYPGYGTYYNVEISKTDEFGQTIVKLEQEDVDYKFLYLDENGQLIDSSQPMKIICTTTPCSIELTAGTLDHIVGTIVEYEDIDYTLNYNNATKYIVFTYNDPSGLTSSMRMQTIRIHGWGEEEVCDTTLSGSAGIISCFVNGTEGSYIVRVGRAASPFLPFVNWALTIDTTWQTFAAEGLTWMFLLTLVMFFMGLAVSPVVGILLAMGSFVFMLATGIVFMPYILVITIIIVATIVIIKMNG